MQRVCWPEGDTKSALGKCHDEREPPGKKEQSQKKRSTDTETKAMAMAMEDSNVLQRERDRGRVVVAIRPLGPTKTANELFVRCGTHIIIG